MTTSLGRIGREPPIDAGRHDLGSVLACLATIVFPPTGGTRVDPAADQATLRLVPRAGGETAPLTWAEVGGDA